MVPSFSILLLISGNFLFKKDLDDERGLLAARIGNLAARVAVALDYHEAHASDSLAKDLIAPLAAEPAVLCVIFDSTKSSQTYASYPTKVGCAGQNKTLSLALTLGVNWDKRLFVAFTEKQIKEKAVHHTSLVASVMILSFLIMLASASLGFKLIIGRRVCLIINTIRKGNQQGTRTQLSIEGKDELAEFAAAYNELVKIEDARQMALKITNEELLEQSYQDPLTGLLNRRGYEVGAKQLHKTVNKRSLRYLLVILIDIDHFKKINDTYGHTLGDQVISLFAKRLKSATRNQDIVARWGGEEFIYLSYIEHSGDGLAIVRKLLDVTRAAWQSHGEGPKQVTASLGACIWGTEPNESALSFTEKLLDLADSALYLAKTTGRDKAFLISRRNDSKYDLSILAGQELVKLREQKLIHLTEVASK